MSNVTTIYGNPIIFDSKNTSPIDLRASGTKSLLFHGNIAGDTGIDGDVVIDGDLTVTGTVSKIGPVTNVLYNGITNITTNDNFNYDETNLSVPAVKTEYIHGITTTDDLGYNEIYEGDSATPQVKVTALTSVHRLMGTDVDIAKNDSTVALASPFYQTNDSYGGVSVWDEGLSTFAEYGSSLSIINFTLDSTVRFSAINESGDRICLTDNAIDAIPRITTYTRSGATWTADATTITGLGMKLSGTRILTYDYNSVFKTLTRNGGNTAWVAEQTLYSPGPAFSLNMDYPISISDTRLLIGYSNTVRVYDYAASWTLTETLTAAALTSLDYYNGVICFVASNVLTIRESGVTVTFSVANTQYCCTNGTYVFLINTSGVIRIYHKVLGVWTVSVNTSTAPSGTSGKMSANAGFLILGAPSTGAYGTGYFYDIVAYTNSEVNYNTITMLNLDNDLEIYSSEQTVFSGGEVVVENTTQSTSSITGSLTTAGGIGIAKDVYVAGKICVGSSLCDFASALYYSNTSRALTPLAATTILFENTYYNNLSYLTYSAGTFTNASGFTINLLVSYQIRPSGAGEINTGIYPSGYSAQFGQCYDSDPLHAYACSGSSIIRLAPAATFVIGVYTATAAMTVSDATGFLNSQVSILRIPG